MRLTLPLVLVSGSLALAACGSSDSSEKENTSPSVALKEIGETRAALTKALATYKGGDKQGAQDQVAEAYVSHFEEVEQPLDAKDHALKESLERAISTDLRDAMKAGRPAATVGRQVKAIQGALDKAEAALR